jgi:hypothetical protein
MNDKYKFHLVEVCPTPFLQQQTFGSVIALFLSCKFHICGFFLRFWFCFLFICWGLGVVGEEVGEGVDSFPFNSLLVLLLV